MIEQIKRDLGNITKISSVDEWRRHCRYLIDELEQEKQTLTLEKQFFDNLVTRSQEIEDRLTDRVEELQKALTIVRDAMGHKKNDDRTSWSLWDIANNALERSKSQ